jgi:hypothetical protein
MDNKREKHVTQIAGIKLLNTFSKGHYVKGPDERQLKNS